MKKIALIVCAVILAFGSFPASSRAEVNDRNVKPVPVIFVHGYNDSADSWISTSFYQWLNQTYTDTYTVNYGDDSQNDITSPELYMKIEEAIKKAAPNEPVDIVVHSMGGLITRYYLLQRLQDGKAEYMKRIRKVIFLQTPNRGSLQAFSGRLMDMVEHKNKYFDFNDKEVKQRYEEYKELYKEYASDMRKKLTWKHMSYENWLISKKKSDIFDRIKAWETSSPLNIGLKIGADAKNGAMSDRYTRAFEEYALMMAARLDVRSNLALTLADQALKSDFIYDVKSHETDIKAYPNKDILNNLVSTMAQGDWKELIPWFGDSNGGGVEERAIDRLMLEQFYIFDAVRDDGRRIYRTVTANPFLSQLNREEAAYRSDRISKGEYVPQYITVASKTDKYVSEAIFKLFDIGVWGVSSKERDNDLVVPVSSVALPEELLDNYVYLNEQASHTTKGPLTGLRDQEELLKRLFFNPLTGSQDESITIDFLPDQAIQYTSNLIRLVPSPVLKESKGSYEIEIHSEETDRPNVYMIKRDQKQMWQKLERVNLAYYEGQYLGTVTLKPDDKVSDYLFLSIGAKVHSKSGAFTMKYTPEALEDTKDSRKQPYYIEMVNQKTDISSKWITQQFRVFDSTTGRPTQHLNVSDFIFGDSDHSFATGNQIFGVQKSKIEAGDHVMLNLDYSGSMDGWPIIQSMNAAEDFISGIKKDVNIGVMGFASDVHVLSKFTKDYAEAAKSPFTDDIHGGTALYDAVIASVEKLASQSGNKTLLVMTDGMNSEGANSIEDAIAAANDRHVRIYAVGLGQEIDKDGLERLTNATGGRVYYTYDPEKLASIYNRVYAESDAVYYVTYPISGKNIDRIFEVTLTAERSNTASVTYTKESQSALSLFKKIMNAVRVK